MKYVFKALKPLSTCWSVGKKVVETAVHQLCQLCAARVTWYSFHSNASDAALLCLNADVEDDQMFQMVIPTSQSLQPEFSV